MAEWDWPHAPVLLEDVYNFEDVLQVGCILNTFIRRSDRVRIACIAQLVNVIAPIMTAPGGSAWRQTIYYPFKFASQFGRGTALRLDVDCPTYDADIAAGVSYLDISGVHDADAGKITFFAINRNGDAALEVDLSLEGFGAARGVTHTVIRHDDLEARNTADNQTNVVPVAGTGARLESGGLSLTLPPYSYSLVQVEL